MSDILDRKILSEWGFGSDFESSVSGLAALARAGGSADAFELERRLASAFEASAPTAEALLDLLARDDSDAKAFALASIAVRRTSEILPDGRRLCAAVFAGPPPGVDFFQRIAGAGLPGLPSACAFEALETLGPSETFKLARAVADGSARVAPPASGFGAALFLVGARAGGWDRTTTEDAGLAFVSVAELLAADGSRAPIAVSTFSEALLAARRTADASGFGALVEQAAAMAKTPNASISLCLSLFDRPGETLLRAGVRGLETGFLLGGFDWGTFPSADEAKAFVSEACAGLGLGEICLVDGSQLPEACPVCGEALHPMPDNPSWIEQALDAGLPPDGSHAHGPNSPQ